MARAVLLLFALFAFLTVLRGLRIFFEAVRRGSAPGRPPVPPAREGDMVRDPVCGTWVPPSESLALRTGHEIHYFCSAECRESFRKSA